MSDQKEEVSKGVSSHHRLLVGTGTPELKPLGAEKSHQYTNGEKGLLAYGHVASGQCFCNE